MGEMCPKKAQIIQPEDVGVTVYVYFLELYKHGIESHWEKFKYPLTTKTIEHFTTQYIKTFIISLKLS